MVTIMEFDAKKFRELVLYVANKSVEDPAFGATKLNKILFFSDFLAYGRFGKPITGATYQRLEHGPAPRELLSVQEELQGRGEAIVVERTYFSYFQKRLFPLRDPDLSRFLPQEVALVDDIIDVLRHHSALEVSLLSHVLVRGWQLEVRPKTLRSGPRRQIPIVVLARNTAKWRFPARLLGEEREKIPYEAVFLSAEPPTPTDVKRGQELARGHGWLAV